jgi:hypothetical protein
MKRLLLSAALLLGAGCYNFEEDLAVYCDDGHAIGTQCTEDTECCDGDFYRCIASSCRQLTSEGCLDVATGSTLGPDQPCNCDTDCASGRCRPAVIGTGKKCGL